MPAPSWLPDTVEYSSYGSNWHDFNDDIYDVFCQDFVHHTVYLNRKRVKISRVEIQGKVEGFWKLISDNFNTPREKICIERSQRIPWVKPIIENASDGSVTVYRDERKKKGHARRTYTVLWLEELDYKVVLREHPNHFFLVSSHFSNWPHSRRRQERERDDYFNSL